MCRVCWECSALIVKGLANGLFSKEKQENDVYTYREWMADILKKIQANPIIFWDKNRSEAHPTNNLNIKIILTVSYFH